jgi:hypothetical protein
VVLAAACGGDDLPSCQQAFGSFYGAGCALYDISTNPPGQYSQTQATAICQQINIDVPERCRDRYEDWLICIDSIATMSQCETCSQEMDALFACD